MSENKVIAIIQARMGSIRLPGKTLADVNGKPMLVRVMDRVKLAKELDQIIIATTIAPVDESIVKLCQEYGYQYYQGSVQDVLSRYFFAASEHNAQIIVRLCADSPLLDPQLIDEAVRAFLSATPRVDYLSNRIERRYPIGLDVEVFSFNALQKAQLNATENYQREHVTPYMYEPGSPCTVKSLVGKSDFSNYRWTVDMPQDLELVRKIYAYFKSQVDFSWLDVVELMKNDSNLTNINKDILQKDYKSCE